MKIAYFDCFSGISGDMVLGAFVDCGLKLSLLKKELLKLKIGNFDIKAKQVKRGHIKGTKIDLLAKKRIRFNDLKSIITVIDKSAIEHTAKQLIKEVFVNLAKAEAKVHKQNMNLVHFHQLGELDTIVDIAGCVLAMKLLGISKIYSSPLTIGTGRVRFKKYSFPLPAPATLELIKGRTLNINSSITHELITPTGAAILSTLTEEITEFLPMRIQKIGYGAGSDNNNDLPSLLRVVIAELAHSYKTDNITVVEANIDDMLPFKFEILFERLFSAGALDVYTTPVMMKKSRLGTLISVQAHDKDLDRILEVIFKEATTLGVRLHRVDRRKLDRKTLNIKTDYGIIVRVKLGFLNSEIVNIAPEYEDCKKIAQKKSLPVKMVYDRIKARAVSELL